MSVIRKRLSFDQQRQSLSGQEWSGLRFFVSVCCCLLGFVLRTTCSFHGFFPEEIRMNCVVDGGTKMSFLRSPSQFQ
jgi:hypothetical protein